MPLDIGTGIRHPAAVQPVHRHVARVVLFLVIGWNAGCGALKKDESGQEASPGPELASMQLPVGRVHMVRKNGGFVLIRSTRHLQLEPGKEIRTFDSEGAQTATLEVSPARKGQFLTADIVRGKPKAGDQAIMDYSPEAPEPGGTIEAGGGEETQVLE